MAGNRKPRKKMAHRTASYLGGISAVIKNQHCRSSKTPLPSENQTNVVIAYHTAIDAMTGGYAEKSHFDTLVYAMDIGVILAERGIGEEYAESIMPAMNGLIRAKGRYLKTGKFGLDGEAVTALKAVADLHEAQLQVATRGQLEAAINEMHARIAQGNTYRETA